MSYVSPRVPFLIAAPVAPDIGLFTAGRRQCDDWRRTASALRSAATIADEPAVAVAAFDRDDVWQGSVASAFHDELGQWRRRLGGDGVSLSAELVAAADRIEARAAALDAALAGGATTAGGQPGG
jgi:hypothetical protein